MCDNSETLWEQVKMQWVECPLLNEDGDVVDPPSCSDDEEEGVVVDLLNRREGHCAAVVTVTTGNGDAMRTAEPLPSASFILVCGGYTNGIVSAYPLIAPTSRLPALQWRELDALDEFECDGASLTTLDAPVCRAAALASSDSPSTAAATVAYLFGGFDMDTNLRNTLYAVRLCCGAGDVGVAGGDVAARDLHVELSVVQTCGAVPEPRARHGAGGCDGRLFIFGGETSAQEQTNDLHVCDVSTGVWRRLDASPTCPSPRLLTLSLVFVRSSAFVLYGGSHFVEGAVQSFADAWVFDTSAERWTQIAGEAQPTILPRSNGHGGGAVVLQQQRRRGESLKGGFNKEVSPSPPSGCADAGVRAVFVGGKDIAEGDDRVKMIGVPANPCVGSADVSVKLALPADGSSKVPHWRYTPAVVTTDRGLLLLAGQCRHTQVPSSFLLTFCV